MQIPGYATASLSVLPKLRNLPSQISRFLLKLGNMPMSQANQLKKRTLLSLN